MNRITIITIMCLLVTVSALAQSPARLALTADDAGQVCSITDDKAGLMSVHIWAQTTDPNGIAAIEFAAPIPACWKGVTWLGDIILNGLTIGDSQAANVGGFGLSLAFAECVGANGTDAYIGYMNFYTMGQSTDCCDYPIVKDPREYGSGIDGPIMVGCSDRQLIMAVTVGATVIGDESCGCANSTPIEASTWGRIKSLYN